MSYMVVQQQSEGVVEPRGLDCCLLQNPAQRIWKNWLAFQSYRQEFLQLVFVTSYEDIIRSRLLHQQ